MHLAFCSFYSSILMSTGFATVRVLCFRDHQICCLQARVRTASAPWNFYFRTSLRVFLVSEIDIGIMLPTTGSLDTRVPKTET